MNRNMLVGVVAGLGIAVAGGVAGFSMMGASTQSEEQIAEELETGSAEVADAPAPSAAPAAAPAARPAAAPAPRPAPQPVRQEVVAAQPQTVERCWEEEVEVPAEARDDKAIAGTAAGAVIGGVVADRVGDDNDLVTAAGAAAGAFFGRKAQRRYQENRTTTEIVTRCEQVAVR